ncbi:dhx29 [Symbiodinium sp. CCMP2456]|nr:dhx29 [Symbiodinium sp. CCMP2456]
MEASKKAPREQPRSDPPKPSDDSGYPHDAAEGGQSWAPGPLGAMHSHTSKAERDKERREKQEARAQQQNRRQAMEDVKRLANMKARVLLARKMRQLLAKALGLGEAFAEASRRGELEELTDLEATALATLQSWGFASDAAMNALAVAREETGCSVRPRMADKVDLMPHTDAGTILQVHLLVAKSDGTWRKWMLLETR